jgi:hypothetical protein
VKTPARALVTLALVSSAACGAGAPSTSPSNGAEVVVGYYTKIDFYPLTEQSDECPVLWGLQGGNWTMPTIRAKRLGPAIQASGKLVLGGELLGEATLEDNMVDRKDGWLELTYLPIPVTHATPREADPIDDIYQKRARLVIDIHDEVQSNHIEHGVVLIQSEVTE